MTTEAKRMLDIGARFPFDATDEWRNSEGVEPPPPADWAHAAARGILADLTDHQDLVDQLGNLAEDVRAELTVEIARIIRAGVATSSSWSVSSATKILAELTHTQGVGRVLDKMEEGGRVELAINMVEIIRTAAADARFQADA